MSSKEIAIETIRRAADKWPTSFVPRPKFPDFSGGLYSTGYLANLDSSGKGPKGAFRIGRQICYPVESVCDWLIERIGATE